MYALTTRYQPRSLNGQDTDLHARHRQNRALRNAFACRTRHQYASYSTLEANVSGFRLTCGELTPRPAVRQSLVVSNNLSTGLIRYVKLERRMIVGMARRSSSLINSKVKIGILHFTKRSYKFKFERRLSAEALRNQALEMI